MSMILPRPDPAIICRAMPDGAVLFSPASERYFGLNPTGALVWEFLARAQSTMDELCVSLMQTYPDAPADQIRHDVAGILDSLTTNELVFPA